MKTSCDHNEYIKMFLLDKCLENLKLILPDIQKDIVHALASETIKTIVQDLKDSLFSILVDEAQDASIKEQITIVLWYINNYEQVIKHILSIVILLIPLLLSLKIASEDLFFKHNLSLSQFHGQGHDGASNI